MSGSGMPATAGVGGSGHCFFLLQCTTTLLIVIVAVTPIAASPTASVIFPFYKIKGVLL